MISAGPVMDAVFANMLGLATEWSQDVAKRRQVSEVDPVADALEYAASELAAEVTRLKEDMRQLTPEEYAAVKGGGVTAQAVRNWIKAGELEAVRGPRGWLIAVTAERRKKQGTAA